MRLRRSPTVALLCCLGWAAWAPLCGAQEDDLPLPAMPTQEEVHTALDKVAADPQLTPQRTVHTLRWIESNEQKKPSSWLEWLGTLARFLRGMFGWLAESGRALLWVLGTILAGLLVVFLLRLARRWRRGSVLPKGFVAPSHVRDLDIRPESLPDDVGAAAAALWDAGEQRAALALLYRGAVSRLVHAHGIPIRASSTEGDCLTLAEPLLDKAAADYFSRLVKTWLNAVYGGLVPATPIAHELCHRFADALGPHDTAAIQGLPAT